MKTDRQLTVFKVLGKDAFVTVVGSGVTIALTVALTAILARFLFAQDYANYLFIRRFIAFIFPVTTLSIGVGLTKFVAGLKDENDNAQGLFSSVILIIFLFNTILLIMATLTSPWIASSSLFPLGEHTRTLWNITFFWLFGYSGYVLLYAYYRGIIAIKKAALINILFNGAAPLSILFFLYMTSKPSLALFMGLWGVTYGLCFVVCFHIIGLKSIIGSMRFVSAKTLKKLFSYCLSRVPAGVLLTVIGYCIPVFLTISGGDTVDFLPALMVLNMIHYGMEPIGQVFLPHSARWHNANELKNISVLFQDSVEFLSIVGVVKTIYIIVWAPVITLAWFGPQYEGVGTAVRLLALSITPALLYSPIRSLLDGIETKPIITWCLAISACATVVSTGAFYLVGKLTLFSACAMVVVYHFMLVGLLVAALSNRIEIKFGKIVLIDICVVVVLVVFANILMRISLGSPSTFWNAIISLIISSAATFILTFMWAAIRKPSWWPVISSFFKNAKSAARD